MLLRNLHSRIEAAMSISHFERLVDQAIEECVQAIFNTPLGDSHRHALIKGERGGLLKAKELYKQAFRVDEDGDGI